jgi:AcrR family transcriptional regulator
VLTCQTLATATETRRRSDGERSRQTILRAAANLATVHGLEGISIGSLAAHIGMSKSGLYAHFRSKEQLQLETVDTALEIFGAEVVAPLANVADPGARLWTLYERFLDYVERRVFPGGCFFASVEAEFDTLPGAVQDRIREIQGARTEQIHALIRDAQTAGAISADEDPAQLAFDLNAAALMGNTMFVLHDDVSYLELARAAIRRRLGL